MSILWTALRFPDLSTWGCCGLIACVLGVENPDLYPGEWLPMPGFNAQGKQGPGGKDARQGKNKQAARRPFLGFQLPKGNTAKLGERQRFEIVPKLSRVGVDLSTPIGSVTAKSSRITGGMVAAPKSPATKATAWLVVKTAGLSTGNRKHDAMIHDALEAKQHPEISFTLRSLKVSKLDSQAQKLTGTAHCTMWICGQAHRLQVPVEVHQERGRGLVVKGEVKMRLSKMGVKVPTTFGIPMIHDEITLWLGVRGRHLGSERQHKPKHKVVADAR